MNKTPRLSKSGIEYLDYSWGIFSGCENWANGICLVPNCWARSIADRFPNHYPDGFNPHYYPEALDSPKYLKKPSIIGVGWVGDVIGYCTKVSEKSSIMQTILQCPQHRFLFLTKNPENLPQWSPFPDNCWVGVTVTSNGAMTLAMTNLVNVDAPARFLSFEPLLGSIGFNDHIRMKSEIDWVIIGAQTKPYKPPNPFWIHEIIVACREAGIPYFLKDNLRKCLTMEAPYYRMPGTLIQAEGFSYRANKPILIQEMPNSLMGGCAFINPESHRPYVEYINGGDK